MAHAGLDSRIKGILSLPVLCLFLTAACNNQNPVGPTVALDQQFVLAPGEIASIEGTVVRVLFEEVASDSRCPINALCVTAGDAVVVIRVTEQSGSSRYELHISDPSRRHATHRDVRVELVALQPHPISGRRTDPAEYRATFTASRSG